MVGAAWAGCSNTESPGLGPGSDNGGTSGAASNGGSAGNGSVVVEPSPEGGAGGERDPSVCADVDVKVTRTIPTLALLIEQSNGMDQPLEQGKELTRWDALKEVLLGESGVIVALERDVRLGVVLYGNPPPYFPECPDLTEAMPPALENYAKIAEVYGNATTIPNAPTGDSLRAAAARLEAVTEPGPKYIVLGTNGDPDRCDENGGQILHDDASKALVVSAAQEAHEKGITTLVVNVGRGPTTRAHLQAVANAGAGLAPDAKPGATLYEPTTREELREALVRLVNGTRTCSFDLRGEVEAGSAHRGTVTVDGEPLPMSDDNGWRLVTASQIELTGPACDAFMEGEHELRARFPCDVVVVR
jgi:hypothetical protein